MKPTIAIPKEVNVADPVWSEETFAPILTVGVFDELEEAIEWNNGVPQVCFSRSLDPASFASFFVRELT